MPDGPRYEDDFYAWTQHQAEVLRTMPVSDNRFDREHVAEEIEDLSKSERDAVRSQIRGIIEHFLKLAYSPAQAPRFDWMETIVDARQELFDKLTPTLRREVEGTLEKLYGDARRRAALGLQRHGKAEAAKRLPGTCPCSWGEICQEDWYPGSIERDPETEAR
ncbi:MAG: DUF29 domain-containing protein [Alphaproteobacteria bacterium]|nr:DUF29 domain-containing protein [Alphaproteobacteria bacterium]